MAIEDGICIARLLPLTTPASAVQERLQMFEDIRYKHVEFVRDETRKNGLDESQRPSSSFNSSIWKWIPLTSSRHVPHDEVLLRTRRMDQDRSEA